MKRDKTALIGAQVNRRTVLKHLAIAATIPCISRNNLRAAAESLNVTGMAVDKALPAMPRDIARAVVPQRAMQFDLAEVRLLPGPFYDAQMRDAKWLLSLDPDRLLCKFLKNAGLPPKGNTYGGWEDTNLSGHIAGHYLSACAVMYRATGIAEFKRRAEYMVLELARCQHESESGLTTGMPNSRATFAKINATGVIPPWSEAWAPWYNVHKTFAGVRDVYLYCGSDQAKSVFLNLCDWALTATDGMGDEKIARMLSDEHGGMLEVAADAYAATGDRKYLELVRRFTHYAILDPMANKQNNVLDGQHSNTNIPKFIGCERVFGLTGDKKYRDGAVYFWVDVVGNRTYSNGGNGDQEHFFPAGDFDNHFNSDENTETCSTYNMLKLTEKLFAHSARVECADYAERASLNHILASQEPLHGMVCYFTPFKTGHFRVYGGPENAMWCCTGTGMENHARYGLSIYYQTPDRAVLYVNQYISSTLDWKDAGIRIQMNANLPFSEQVTLKLSASEPSPREIKLRKPYWTEAVVVEVNGKTIDRCKEEDGYLCIERSWSDNDEIQVHLPMKLRFESTPHSANKCSIMYGPALLAMPMGTSGMDLDMCRKYNVPAAKLPDNSRMVDILDGWTEAAYRIDPALDAPTLVGERDELLKKIRLVDPQTLTFKSAGAGDPSDLTLVPFYSLHHQRYNVYWNVYNVAEWKMVKAKTAEENKRQQLLDARTTDVVIPGNQQSEIDHGTTSNNSGIGAAFNRPYRDANNGWFSYVMKVDSASQLELVCTYWGGDGGRTFDVLVENKKIATQHLTSSVPGQFFDVAYKIPSELVAGKSSVTITLKSAPGSFAGGLFGARILRKK